MTQYQVIKNPVTGRSYTIRRRSEVNPETGRIKGLWEKK